VISPINPNLSPTLAALIEDRRRAAQADKSPLTLHHDPDVATACCLALIADPSTNILPVGALDRMTAINNELINAPRTAIVKALARQTAILEAASVRFASRAAITGNADHAEKFTRMSTSCSTALLAALSAIYKMHMDEVGDV
jgi:hypothetical protein